MGDRANCVVHQNLYEDEDNPPVWLYTHWRGTGLPVIVQQALIRGKPRWDDPPYLTRIIFDEMTSGQHGGETGFGISTSVCDNEHDYVVVDPRTQEVRIEDPTTREVKQRWSFEGYCGADLSKLGRE